MQTGNIRCNSIWCAVIINNIIRHGKALSARGLSGENMFSMLARDMVSHHGSLDLRLGCDINHQYPIGFLMQLIFHQQRNHPQDIGRAGFGYLTLCFLVDNGMEQGIKPGFFR